MCCQMFGSETEFNIRQQFTADFKSKMLVASCMEGFIIIILSFIVQQSHIKEAIFVHYYFVNNSRNSTKLSSTTPHIVKIK